MEFSIYTLWFFLISILSGALAGMGMGGGTLLIPALTLILGVEHKLAQCINLLVFIPSAIVAMIIYTKDKKIDYKNGWMIALFATLIAGFAALFALKIDSKILKIIFASFIVGLGLFQIIFYVIKKIKRQGA